MSNGFDYNKGYEIRLRENWCQLICIARMIGFSHVLNWYVILGSKGIGFICIFPIPSINFM